MSTELNLTQYYQHLSKQLASFNQHLANVDQQRPYAYEALENIAQLGCQLEKSDSAIMGSHSVKALSGEIAQLAKTLCEKDQIQKLGEPAVKRALPVLSVDDSEDQRHLLLAILYYRHLSDYPKVAYQGNVGWLFKSKVIETVEEKRADFARQAAHLHASIVAYLKTNPALNLTSEQLLMQEGESDEDYVLRLISVLVPSCLKSANHAEVPQTSEDSPLALLQEDFTRTQHAYRDASLAVTSFSGLVQQAVQARDALAKCIADYRALPLWQKAWHWICSWFVTVPALESLQRARTAYQQCRTELDATLGDKTAQDYQAQLQLEQDTQHKNFGNAQQALAEYKSPVEQPVLSDSAKRKEDLNATESPLGKPSDLTLDQTTAGPCSWLQARNCNRFFNAVAENPAVTGVAAVGAALVAASLYP